MPVVVGLVVAALVVVLVVGLAVASDVGAVLATKIKIVQLLSKQQRFPKYLIT